MTERTTGDAAGPRAAVGGGGRSERLYLREVERHFRSRRGEPLLLSPRDWALAVAWFEQGIPLAVVLGGIDAAFEGAGRALGRRGARTLAYCAPLVERRWEAIRRGLIPRGESPGETDTAPVGSPARGSSGASEERSSAPGLAGAIEQAAGRVRGAAGRLAGAPGAALEEIAAEILRLVPDLASTGSPACRRAEERLAELDGLVLGHLAEGTPAEEIETLRRQAAERLAPHRPHMSRAAYAATEQRAVENRLRERHGIPRLSVLLLIG